MRTWQGRRRAFTSSIMWSTKVTIVLILNAYDPCTLCFSSYAFVILCASEIPDLNVMATKATIPSLNIEVPREGVEIIYVEIPLVLESKCTKLRFPPTLTRVSMFLTLFLG